MPEPVLKIAREGHVAIVTMNRPAKLNAFSRDLTAAMYDALDEIEAAFPDVRAVVLTGAGRGFCAGADVQSMAANLESMANTPVNPRGTIVYLGARLRALPQPVVAAVNGVAAGAGLSLALASDVRIASTLGRFACSFVKRALVPDTGCCATLPRAVGPGVAAEMALTGRVYDADWALRVGLVGMVVEPDALMNAALELAAEIAANPPVAVKATKEVMQRFTDDLKEVAAVEAEINRRAAGSHDRREAMRAFLEKRTPVFRGD